MGDVNAGTVKANVEITYDGSGVDKAKEDLKSLTEAASGAGGSASEAGDQFAEFGSKAEEGAGGAKTFMDALAPLPKIAESGGESLAGMSEETQKSRQAFEDFQQTTEDTGSTIEKTSSNIEKASTPIATLTERTQGLNENLSQVQQTLSDSSDAWSQYSSTVQDAIPSTSANEFAQLFNVSPEVQDNLKAFQSALASPDSFQVIDDHLAKTGQFYEDFANSLGTSNQELLHQMSNDWVQTNSFTDEAGRSFANLGKDAQTGFSTVASSAGSADEAVSEFLGKTTSSVEEVGGAVKSAGFGDILGEAFGSMSSVLNDVAMPLMAAQMIGMAVQQGAQQLYDMAAVAEGPAAHSVGTFTGTVDALGQTMQKIGGQFAESFGQQLIPTFNAMNYEMSQSNQNAGDLGGTLGGVTGFLANMGNTVTGSLLMLNPVTFNAGWSLTKASVEGMVNQGAQWMGAPQPFQGPGPIAQYQQQMAQLPQAVQAATQQLQYQSSLTLAEAVDPNWLAANNKATASQQAAQYLIQSYDRSHPQSQYDLIQQAREINYDNQQGQLYQQAVANQPGALFSGDWGQVGKNFSDFMGGIGAIFSTPLFTSGGQSPHNLTQPPSLPFDGIGGFFGGIGADVGGFFGGIGNFFSGLFGGGAGGGADFFGGGCFPAGTAVRMSDGSTRPIEALQVGDAVLAHDGEKQVVTTVRARIVPPLKPVYELVFSDGNTLTLTDAHPVSTMQGWKSISPEATVRENPGLSATTLRIGDSIHTVDGVVTLTSILPLQGTRQVYNIHVNAPNTFYANGALVHNKMMTGGGGPSSMTNSGVGSEQVSLSHTFTANVTWAANNLEKAFTGTASWNGVGLAKQFVGQAIWAAQGLEKTFEGVANWVAQGGLEHTFEGVASWLAQGGLEHTFEGVANWLAQGGLEHTFEGLANWVGQGLENLFTGKASWDGKDLEHMFTATAQWTAQNLSPNFAINPSFTMLAEGTSNWGGGPAVVGEAGTELVEHNGQYSLFDSGAALVNLPAGANVYPMQNLASHPATQFADGTAGSVLPLSIGVGGGNAMPQSISVIVNLDSQSMITALGLPFAQTIRVASGLRSY